MAGTIIASSVLRCYWVVGDDGEGGEVYEEGLRVVVGCRCMYGTCVHICVCGVQWVANRSSSTQIK